MAIDHADNLVGWQSHVNSYQGFYKPVGTGSSLVTLNTQMLFGVGVSTALFPDNDAVLEVLGDTTGCASNTTLPNGTCLYKSNTSGTISDKQFTGGYVGGTPGGSMLAVDTASPTNAYILDNISESGSSLIWEYTSGTSWSSHTAAECSSGTGLSFWAIAVKLGVVYLTHPLVS